MYWQQICSIIGCPIGLMYILSIILSHRNRRVIKDKVVMITGASSGLGKACAKIFHSAGCKVIMCGRNEEELQKVKQEILSQKLQNSHSPEIMVMDITDTQQIEDRVSEAVKMFGCIDILINNAGVSYRGQINDTGILVDKRVMEVNYFGQVALVKAVLPHMLSKKSGFIVGISSVQGKVAIPYRSAYAASKHAMQAFFDTLRAEVADENIGVCVFSPGYIKTNLSSNAICADGSTYNRVDKTTENGMDPEYVAKQIFSSVVLHKQDIVLAPFIHKIVIYIRTLFPSLYCFIMKLRAKQGRQEISKLKSS